MLICFKLILEYEMIFVKLDSIYDFTEGMVKSIPFKYEISYYYLFS